MKDGGEERAEGTEGEEIIEGGRGGRSLVAILLVHLFAAVSSSCRLPSGFWLSCSRTGTHGIARRAAGREDERGSGRWAGGTEGNLFRRVRRHSRDYL